MAVNRLKTTYQRNMLIGQGVSLVLVLFYCVIFCDYDHTRDVINQSFTSSVIIEYPDEYNNSTFISGKINIGGRRPEMMDGFLGFNVSFRIIPEVSADHSPIPSPVVFQPNHPFIRPESVSFSPIDGDQLGVYTPNEYDYIFRMDKHTQSIERDVTVLRKRDPEYPFVAQERGVEKLNVIVLFVASAGSTLAVNCKVPLSLLITEDPPAPVTVMFVTGII